MCRRRTRRLTEPSPLLHDVRDALLGEATSAQSGLVQDRQAGVEVERDALAAVRVRHDAISHGLVPRNGPRHAITDPATGSGARGRVVAQVESTRRIDTAVQATLAGVRLVGHLHSGAPADLIGDQRDRPVLSAAVFEVVHAGARYARTTVTEATRTCGRPICDRHHEWGEIAARRRRRPRDELDHEHGECDQAKGREAGNPSTHPLSLPPDAPRATHIGSRPALGQRGRTLFSNSLATLTLCRRAGIEPAIHGPSGDLTTTSRIRARTPLRCHLVRGQALWLRLYATTGH